MSLIKDRLAALNIMPLTERKDNKIKWLVKLLLIIPLFLYTEKFVYLINMILLDADDYVTFNTEFYFLIDIFLKGFVLLFLIHKESKVLEYGKELIIILKFLLPIGAFSLLFVYSAATEEALIEQSFFKSNIYHWEDVSAVYVRAHYLNGSSRKAGNKIEFSYSAKLKDGGSIELYNKTTSDWYYIFNSGVDVDKLYNLDILVERKGINDKNLDIDRYMRENLFKYIKNDDESKRKAKIIFAMNKWDELPDLKKILELDMEEK